MTWRNVWFQTHWLIGITAGIVLALVGFTGGLLSFEQGILRLLNPGVMTVPDTGRALLSPDKLFALAAATDPAKRITAITVSSDPRSAARAVFADPAGASAGGGRRGKTVFFDPRTGAKLGSELRGEAALLFVEDVHRRLAAGDTGKLIVGISTSLLLVLASTGLYLRWPRLVSSLRAWFTFKFALKGRTFLWHLHAVVATWVLLFYVLAAATGLYWSFEWYRDGLFAITGAPRPQPAGSAREVKPSSERSSTANDKTAPSDFEQIGLLWLAFERAAPAYDTATLTLAKPGQSQVEVRYLDKGAAHERAYNRISLDVASQAVVKHERYDDKPASHRLMSSMFVLHSGSYFGMLGKLAMMLASFAMPLFGVTGWMLYLDRRRKKATLRHRAMADTVTVGVVRRQHAATSHSAPN